MKRDVHLATFREGCLFSILMVFLVIIFRFAIRVSIMIGCVVVVICTDHHSWVGRRLVGYRRDLSVSVRER